MLILTHAQRDNFLSGLPVHEAAGVSLVSAVVVNVVAALAVGEGQGQLR